jgi:hypothetical protein
MSVVNPEWTFFGSGLGQKIAVEILEQFLSLSQKDTNKVPSFPGVVANHDPISNFADCSSIHCIFPEIVLPENSIVTFRSGFPIRFRIERFKVR